MRKEQNLEEFGEKRDKKYGYISKSWRDNWEQLSTFWTYPDEIRRLIYTTNPIFNRGLRKVTKNRPSFPDENSLLKSLFLGIQRIQKKMDYKNSQLGSSIFPAPNFVQRKDEYFKA